MLDTAEINSLIFYQGDVNNYIVNSKEEKLKYSSSFYKTRFAYHVLNMLLYPCMDNEIARICNEKKNIPLDLLYSIEEILNVYNNIFSSMCKYAMSKSSYKTLHVFRQDRIQSLNVLDKGYTPAFTSCSLEKMCDTYFLKKDGILLLEFNFDNTIPYVVLNEVFPNSSFKYQNEVLLPPFLTFQKTPLEFTDEEKTYVDIKNSHPQGKFSIEINGTIFGKNTSNTIADVDASIENISKGSKKAVEILYKLEQNNMVTEQDKSYYENWKKQLHSCTYQMLKSTFNKFYFEK